MMTFWVLLCSLSINEKCDLLKCDYSSFHLPVILQISKSRVHSIQNELGIKSGSEILFKECTGLGLQVSFEAKTSETSTQCLIIHW